MHIYSHTFSYDFFYHSRLGHKIQGVLCDGDSNEVVASTIVNCLKIDEGKTQKYFNYILSFFMCFNMNFLTQACHTLFHRDHHHCEGRLCPCSKSQTDLWQSEKHYGVIVSYLISLFHTWFPTRLASSAPPFSFNNLRNTLWTIWEDCVEGCVCIYITV